MIRLYKTLLLAGGLLLVLAVVLVVAGRGDLLQAIFTGLVSLIKNIWLWIVGLFGFILGSFKKIFSLFGPTQAEKEIHAENEAIKQELERLRAQLKTYDEQFKIERDLHRREREVFEKELAQKNAEINKIRQRIKEKEAAGPEGFYHNLSDEERAAFDEEYFDGLGDLN